MIAICNESALQDTGLMITLSVIIEPPLQAFTSFVQVGGQWIKSRMFFVFFYSLETRNNNASLIMTHLTSDNLTQ